MPFLSFQESMQFVLDRLATREWWLIPVSNVLTAELLDQIVQKHYTGDNALLIDVIVAPEPTRDVALLSLVLASKSCMSPQQLRETTGLPVPEDGSQDILIHSTTPASVLVWMLQNLGERARD